MQTCLKRTTELLILSFRARRLGYLPRHAAIRVAMASDVKLEARLHGDRQSFRNQEMDMLQYRLHMKEILNNANANAEKDNLRQLPMSEPRQREESDVRLLWMLSLT